MQKPGHAARLDRPRSSSLVAALTWMRALSLLPWLGLGGCGGPQTSPAAEEPAQIMASDSSGGEEPLRTEEAVSNRLKDAEMAYLEGRFGDAVVAANQVMQGLASPEQFYSAVKILGLASCSRRDLRPIHHAYKRLNQDDRESLRKACAEQGITLDPEPSEP